MKTFKATRIFDDWTPNFVRRRIKRMEFTFRAGDIKAARQIAAYRWGGDYFSVRVEEVAQ